MKIKDLKAKINDLPDDMEIMVIGGDEARAIDPYHYLVYPVISAKPKRVRNFKGHVYVQSRPVKDDQAVLALIIE